MTELNLTTITNANRGLSICFIITLLAANVYLIFATVRKGGFIYTPKSLIMISMAIGDIFLALFPLIVMARVFFEETDFSLSCSTAIASTVYLKCFIHFVYGVGLITMAVELVHRYKTKQSQVKSTVNIVKSFVYSAVPWLLGLIVILPLSVGSFDESELNITQTADYAFMAPNLLWCFKDITAVKVLSLFGISVLLPAPLAVVVCFIIMCIRLLPAYYSAPAVVTYPGSVQSVVMNTQNINIGNAATISQYPVSNGSEVQHYPIDNPPGAQHHPSNCVSATSQFSTALSDDTCEPNLGTSTSPTSQYPAEQYPPPAYSVQQCPPPQYLPPQYQQYPPSSFPVQLYTPQSNVVIAAPAYVVQVQNPAVPALPDPGKEKNALLVVSFVNFLCVVPSAIDTMIFWPIDFVYDELAIVEASLFWLSVFRSLITPLMFIGFNSLYTK